MREKYVRRVYFIVWILYFFESSMIRAHARGAKLHKRRIPFARATQLPAEFRVRVNDTDRRRATPTADDLCIIDLQIAAYAALTVIYGGDVNALACHNQCQRVIGRLPSREGSTNLRDSRRDKIDPLIRRPDTPQKNPFHRTRSLALARATITINQHRCTVFETGTLIRCGVR